MAGTNSPAGLPDELDARFREVMDGAPVMIWMSGEDALCTWLNEPWLAFTGRSMTQEQGKGWLEGVHPEDFDRCLETYLRNFNDRRAFRMEYRLRRNDGEYRWIDDIGNPRHSGDGRFLGYIGSASDIHERKIAEAELREAKRALEQGAKAATTRLEGEIAAHGRTERDLLRSSAQLTALIQGIKDYAIYSWIQKAM